MKGIKVPEDVVKNVIKHLKLYEKELNSRTMNDTDMRHFGSALRLQKYFEEKIKQVKK